MGRNLLVLGLYGTHILPSGLHECLWRGLCSGVRGRGLLRSSSPKDLEIGPNSKMSSHHLARSVFASAAAQLAHIEAKVIEGGPGIGLEFPGASPSLCSLYY
jgi:hypothetical protein